MRHGPDFGAQYENPDTLRAELIDRVKEFQGTWKRIMKFTHSDVNGHRSPDEKKLFEEWSKGANQQNDIIKKQSRKLKKVGVISLGDLQEIKAQIVEAESALSEIQRQILSRYPDFGRNSTNGNDANPGTGQERQNSAGADRGPSNSGERAQDGSGEQEGQNQSQQNDGANQGSGAGERQPDPEPAPEPEPEPEPEKSKSKEGKREEPVFKVLSEEEAEKLARDLDATRTVFGEAKKGSHADARKKIFKNRLLKEIYEDIVREELGNQSLSEEERRIKFEERIGSVFDLSEQETSLMYQEEVSRLRYNQERQTQRDAVLETKQKEIIAKLSQKYGPDQSAWPLEAIEERGRQFASLNADLYQVQVLGEYHRMRTMETKNPWERSKLRAKEIYGKTIEPYLRQNRYARMAATTILFTAAYAAKTAIYAGTPWAVLTATGIYGVRRMAGTMVGLTGSMALGKLHQATLGKKFESNIAKIKQELEQRAQGFGGNFSLEDQECANAILDMDREEGRSKGTRIALMLLGGMLLGIGTAEAMEGLGIGGKDSLFGENGSRKGNISEPETARAGGANSNEAGGRWGQDNAQGGSGGNIPPGQRPPVADAPGENASAGTGGRGSSGGTPDPSGSGKDAGSPESAGQNPPPPETGGKGAGASPVEPEIKAGGSPKSVDIREGDSFWKLEHDYLKKQMGSLTPEELKAKFGLTVDDLDNEAKINRAIDARTLELLKQQGYIKPDGSEVRIRFESGAKAVFDVDGKIKIENGHTYDWSPEKPSATPAEPVGSRATEPGVKLKETLDADNMKTVGLEPGPQLKETLDPDNLKPGLGIKEAISDETYENAGLPVPGALEGAPLTMEAAVSEGLDKYMGGIGEHLLSDAERADVRYFVTQFIHEHPGPFSLEPGAAGLSSGLRTDTIADLMQNKNFMQDAVAYSKECSLLENQRGLFRFSPSELRSPEYLALRQVRVDEFLKNLPEQHGNPENLVGQTAKFKLPSGEKITVSLNKGYGVLANHMDMNQRFAGGGKIGRMSVSEFIKAYEK